ncbi:MAG: hypothetical protein IT337_10330 [Thermomicrobiales bacterium]|nr:hypothetical protein [Thermomicrobiales bacterium]
MRINRRRMMGAALATAAASRLGLDGRLGALAQEASPAAGASPVATYEPVTSIGRQEYADALFAAFPMGEAEQTGGQVIWGQSTDISTTNVILAADDPTNPLLGLIFEGLTSSSVIDGQPVPGLADSWERAADGVTYTFHLNPTVTWHDGEPLTAADVLFSMDAQLDPATGSQYTSSVEAAVQSYRVIDDHTFEVVSDGPRANFLFDLIVPVMPKHIWENVPHAEWAQDPGSIGQDPARVVGSGPFKFVEWVQGDHVTLERNPDYWDTVTGHVPNIDRLTMQVFPDDTTMVQALKTGQIDFNDRLPPAEVEGLQQTPGIAVTVFPTFNFNYYTMNLDPEKTTLFEDVKVRQALIEALDRQAIIENIFLGLGEVAIGTQSLLSTAYAPDKIANPFAFNIDNAKQLMDEAGWTETNADGVRVRDGKPFQFQLTYSEGAGVYEQLVPYMQQQWRTLGINMEPNPVPFPTLLKDITETHDYDMALLAFSWVADPDQKAMFACDQYEGGFNTGRYCNSEYDDLAHASDRELDAEKRLAMIVEASGIVWDDQPVGILRFSESAAAATDKLKNFNVNGYSAATWSMPWVWLASS